MNKIWLSQYEKEVQVVDEKVEFAGNYSPNQKLVRIYKPVSKLFTKIKGTPHWLYRFIEAVLVE